MIEIRSAQPDDRAALVAMCADVFGAEVVATMESLWDWQWRDDPRLDPPGVRGNIAQCRGGIVGGMFFIPAGLFIEGRAVEAWWSVKAMVHPGRVRRALREVKGIGAGRPAREAESNGGGIATRLSIWNHEHVILFGKHVADRMSKEAMKVGFRFLGDTGYWVRRVSLTPRIRRVAGRWLAPLVAAPMNAMLGRLPRLGGSVGVLEGKFDGRFDELWEHARQSYDAIALRDARTLNWRYRQRPDASYTVLMLEDGIRLRGYAVLRVMRVGRYPRGKIIDLLARREDDEARRDLVAASLRVLRKQGAEKAWCYATCPTLAEALRACGFSRHASDDPLTVRNLPPVTPYFTEGDGDGG